MTLSQRLREYVQACFTAIWIESHEHQDAIAELGTMCHEEDWCLATWNIECGLSVAGANLDTQATDPLAALRALPSLATEDGTAILVLQNFHRFLQSAEIVQAVEHQLQLGKQQRTIVVVLSPVVQLPVELEKQFVVLQHDLPGRDELEAIARGIATEDGELPDGRELTSVLDASAGLTRSAAESAFSLSLVRDNRITPETVWEIKEGTLRQSGPITLHRGSEDFSSLGGLSALKAFCNRSLLSSSTDRNANASPRGVMLLSPPGCGKSQFCRCLGKESGRPVLMLDVGAVMGSLIGQSEERIRQALQIAEAMAPSILMIDEVEKAFAGVGGTGDSGVSSRVFGTVLTWLSDHTSDVYVVCTSNDVSKLPPEFVRAERFDGIFFVDLPSRQEKDTIWELYVSGYGLAPDQQRPNDDSWTGAEIKSCCRLASLLDLPLMQAAQNVVPVAVSAGESVERLRSWAASRCLDANNGGVFQAQSTSKRRRKVKRSPSMN